MTDRHTDLCSPILFSGLNKFNANSPVLRIDTHCYSCIVSSTETGGNEDFAVDWSL